MNILNIGGAGYIGSVATEKFIQNKHHVIILDDLSTGFKQAINPKAIFIKGSMLNKNLLDKIFTKYKIDVVALYAAKIVVPESVQKPIDYYLTNVCGLSFVLDAMKNHNVNKIIFASSAAVYGNTKNKIINEDTPVNPCNPYGMSKLMCERILIDTNKAYKINYVILRFFNVAGASDSGKYGMRKEKPTLLIPAINNSILLRQKFNIYGQKYKSKDGTCIRDYIHVEDLANATLLSLKLLCRNKSEIFCLSSCIGKTVLEIVKLVEKNLKIKIDYCIKKNRMGDPDCLIASSKKAQASLHWKIKHSISDMIVSDYNFRKKILFNA